MERASGCQNFVAAGKSGERGILYRQSSSFDRVRRSTVPLTSSFRQMRLFAGVTSESSIGNANGSDLRGLSE